LVTPIVCIAPFIMAFHYRIRPAHACC
jgi:hypothetical protein